MSSAAVRVGVGTHVLYDGENMEIAEIHSSSGGVVAVLKSIRTQHVMRIAISELLAGGDRARVLRMYAPAGTLFRQAITDTEICGHYIPRKSQIAINVYASMRLHDWWHSPDTFNPDRFTTTAQHEAVSRYTFAPFGGGAHKCIGQQFADMTVKTVMHQLLRRFEWSTPHGYELQLTWGTGPTPADALPINLNRIGGVQIG